MQLMTNERKRSLEDFLSATEPAYKESRLLPFWEEIRIARSRKYTLAQIRQWLSENGVGITIQGLSRFIIVQTARERCPDSTGTVDAGRTEASRPKPPSWNIPAPVGKREDRQKETAAQFIREDENSILKSLKDQSK